jgi:hypothetical protein
MKKKLPVKKKLTIKSIISRPRNEAFLSRDVAYLNSNPSIKLGKQIGEGHWGDVFAVEGNKHLAIKVPKHFTNTEELTRSERKYYMEDAEHEIEEEYRQYQTGDFEQQRLMIPTKRVKIVIDGIEGTGLLRPRILPIYDRTEANLIPAKRKLSDKQLHSLFDALIELTHKGYAFHDNLQIGIDSHGRLLVYDLGDVLKYTPSSNIPYHSNNRSWRGFLEYLGKTPSQIAKYGEITR